MTGFANYGWKQETHSAFAQAPFEVLYPPPLRVGLQDVLRQYAARDFAGPLMGAHTYGGGLLDVKDSARGSIGAASSSDGQLEAKTHSDSTLGAKTGVCTE